MQSALSILFLIGIIVLNTLLLLYWTKHKISTGKIAQVFNTPLMYPGFLWITSDIMPQFFQSIGIASTDLPHAQPRH